MRILLIHHNTNNTGDDAMVESTIDQMRSIYPNCSIILESSDPEISRKQFPEIDVVERLFSIRNIHHTGKTLSFEFAFKNIPFLFRTFTAWALSYTFILLKLKKLHYPILAEYKKADLILSMAGDSISEDYAWFFRFYEIWLIHKLRKPLILYAQSIGPFSGRVQKIAAKYLSLVTAIFARDEKTIALLKEYGVKTDIYRTADLAISLKSTTNAITENIIEEFNLNQKTVCIVLRTKKYASLNDIEYQKYLSGMKDVVNHIKKKGLHPIFIASIPEDAQTARDFSAKYNFKHPLLELYTLMPSEVKTLLSKVRLVISPRMHPIILSSSMGTPVIGLGKEFKMYDYLKLLGIEKYFLPMIPFKKEGVITAINRVIDNTTAVRETIKRNLNHANELSNENAFLLNHVINL